MARKLLLISDNEVLNSLYSVNLKIYLDIEVTVISDLENVIDAIQDEEFNFDAVASLCMINNDDIGLIAYHHLIENDRNVSFTVLGKQSETPQEVSTIGNIFDVRSLIQNIAKDLQVTAKEMASINVDNFYAMPIRVFFSLKISPCDTFYKIRREDGSFEYIKIFATSEHVWPRIKTYLDEGVHVLYVDAKDRFLLAKSVTTQLIDKMTNFTPQTERVEKLDIIEQGIESIAEQIFDSEVSKEIVQLSNQCMNALEEVIDELPDLKSLLHDLSSNKSGFLYSHSIIAGYVATHILSNIEWGGDAHKEKLKFVLFFHDMYLVNIYKKFPDLMFEENLLFDAKLSEADKEIVVSHASEAADAIKRFPKCPLGVDTIIRQHHGTTNGLGFATSYKDDISPLSKVLIIAESFTEVLFKCLHEGEKFVIADTISYLLEKYPKHTYVKITKTLENLKI